MTLSNKTFDQLSCQAIEQIQRNEKPISIIWKNKND
jgi:hypothetical protein